MGIEIASLREIAATFLKARTEEIAKALADGTLIEVHNGEEGKEDGKS